jgi:AcrR family transcriptional regulator
MSREIPPKRKYELKKRAEEMAETRRRITEAAIDLHGTVGPSRTTLSAVAKRAGVERRTLYRHFPSEADLFAACSTHYFTANPWPDLGNWRAIRDPQHRLERALDELYAYYERTEPMFSNVLRDAELVDFAREAVTPLHAYLDEAAEILAIGRRIRGRRRRLLGGALRHALAFSTWRSLSTNGIGRSDAANLMSALVEGAAAPQRRSKQGSSPARAARGRHAQARVSPSGPVRGGSSRTDADEDGSGSTWPRSKTRPSL